MRYKASWFRVIISVLIWLVCSAISAAEINFWNDVFQNHGSVMMLMETESGSIIYANNSAALFYGYTIEELQNLRIQDLNTLSPSEVTQERIAAAREGRNYFVFPRSRKHDPRL